MSIYQLNLNDLQDFDVQKQVRLNIINGQTCHVLIANDKLQKLTSLIQFKELLLEYEIVLGPNINL